MDFKRLINTCDNLTSFIYRLLEYAQSLLANIPHIKHFPFKLINERGNWEIINKHLSIPTSAIVDCLFFKLM